MKKIIFLTLVFLTLSGCTSQKTTRFSDLDENDPITLNYNDKNIMGIDVNWTTNDWLAVKGYTIHKAPVFIVDVYTRKAHPLVINDEQIYGDSPVFSSDGSYLALYNYDLNKIQIVRNNATHDLVALLDASPMSLSWSPDNVTLAFLGHDEEIGVEKIKAYDINSGQQKTLMGYWEDRDITGGEIAWSPDGKKIAFSLSMKLLEEESLQYDLFVINISENTLIRLTNTPRISEQYFSWYANDILSFSAYSFAKNDYQGEKLYFADVNKKCIREIKDFEGIMSFSWSPDRKEIAFGGLHGINIIKVNTFLNDLEPTTNWVCGQSIE